MPRLVFSTSSIMYMCVGMLHLWTAESCMKTAWSHGRLAAAHVIQSTTLTSPSAGSCSCCGLCHQLSRCASLSFNTQTSECELYSVVASYATLTPDAAGDWLYLVMPGRSEHGQFCRGHSDCLAPGDACRGRVCTHLPAVTCRAISDTFGAGDAYGTLDVAMFGWLRDRETPLECDTIDGIGGFTQLLSCTSRSCFTSSTVLEHNRPLDPAVGSHSLLGLADEIRTIGTESTYHVTVTLDSNFEPLEAGLLRRDEQLMITENEGQVTISFQNVRGINTSLQIPIAAPVQRSLVPSAYVGSLKYGDGMIKEAISWMEIYIRE